MRKGGITKVNLQWFLHHQETPQNLISTAVLIFQVGIVVACIYAHNRRFMSQARRTRHFARSARWGEEKKNKALFFLLPSIRDSYSSRASKCCVHLASLSLQSRRILGRDPWIVFRNDVVPPSWTLILPESWDESKSVFKGEVDAPPP